MKLVNSLHKHENRTFALHRREQENEKCAKKRSSYFESVVLNIYALKFQMIAK